MKNESPDDYICEALQYGKQILVSLEHLMSEASKSDSRAFQFLAAGKIHEIRQAFHQARSAYQRAVQIDPNIFEASLRLAILHLKEGEYHRGLMMAKALEKENENFVFNDISGRPRSIQTVLGDAYRDCSDLEAAIVAYRMALQLQPKDKHAAMHLASILIEQGEVQAAIELLGSIDGSGFTELNATVKLLTNDPNRLPAIQGIINNIAFSGSNHV